MGALKYGIGYRFGRLVIESRDTFRALCRCDCGGTVNALVSNLRNDHVRSCGCLRKEVTIARSTIHGSARRKMKSRAYGVWCGLHKRCYSLSSADYPNYGGRGIGICDEWREDFSAFLRDMGETPVGLSIERLDNDKNYSKANCKWATRLEQNNNTRQNRFVVFNGKRQTLAQWGRETGMKPHSIRRALESGKTPEEIFT